MTQASSSLRRSVSGLLQHGSPSLVEVAVVWPWPLVLLGLGLPGCSSLADLRGSSSRSAPSGLLGPWASPLLSFTSPSKTHCFACGSSGSCPSSRFQPKLSPRRCARPASFLSWGSQRPSLHRHAHQVSTPTRRERHASVEGCQLLDSFRPCRFSRLRRLAPPERCGLVASRYRSWDSSRFWFVRRQASFRLQPLRRCVPTHPIRFLEGASLPGLHLAVLVPAPSLLARPCDRGRLTCLTTEVAWCAAQPKLCCPRSPPHPGPSSDRSHWALPARLPACLSVSSSRSWRPEGRLRLFQPKLAT